VRAAGARRSNFTSTACGNILEAMKWEKRLESAYTTYGAWYFDSRGWGDLPEGTPLHWPVPVQELDARGSRLQLGGFGLPGGARAGARTGTAPETGSGFGGRRRA
jgi:hypothetical protein